MVGWRKLLGIAGLGLAMAGTAAAERFCSAAEPDCCSSAGCTSIFDSCACAPACCDYGNCGERVLGLLPSDHCFDSFISPLANPFFFEDPRSLTEVRGIFINNHLPPQIGPGNVQVWAGQVRGRVTERLSVIAPRLGSMQIQPDDGATGFMSAPIGLKYNLVRDVENQFLLTAGATYFIPGSQQVFQGYGSGDFHFFLTGGKQIFGNGHWISGSGFRIPASTPWGNQMWYWSNQWDYRLPGNLYPLIGANWFHLMRSPALSFPDAPTFSGLDLVNLPFGSVAGNDIFTCVIGGKWKPSGNIEVGSGWEFPVTGRQDILNNRVYADLILRY